MAGGGRLVLNCDSFDLSDFWVGLVAVRAWEWDSGGVTGWRVAGRGWLKTARSSLLVARPAFNAIWYNSANVYPGWSVGVASQVRVLPLVDAVLYFDDPRLRIAANVFLIIGFALFTALLARISIDLAFTPVPVTGQTLAVLLTGAALGSWRGAAALTVYLFAGGGIPLFAGGSGDYLWSATSGNFVFGFTSGSSGWFWDLASGGYIIGFIAAAYVVGFLTERGWHRGTGLIVAMLAGNILLYIPGLIQLAVFVPNDKVMEWGLYPFIAGDLIKLYIAALLVPAAWKLVGWAQREDPWT